MPTRNSRSADRRARLAACSTRSTTAPAIHLQLLKPSRAKCRESERNQRKSENSSMRTPNKARSRGKGHRRSSGNIVNRVFESSGPEGKVRGNPQQIIEKYQALSRDAFLAGDRVSAENFAQHSEHYARMLRDAQREIEARREQQEAQNASRRTDQQEQGESASGGNGQGKVGGLEIVEPSDGGLVETPESGLRSSPQPTDSQPAQPAE